MTRHLTHMQDALRLAHAALSHDEVPVGCVIVKDGRVVARAGNLTRTNCDSTAHAEILALQEAGRVLGTAHLEGCDLYVTLEPCAMCAGAIAWARIRHLYFGAYDPKSGGVEHGARVFDHTTCHHKPLVTGGLLEQACGQLLKDFFLQKR